MVVWEGANWEMPRIWGSLREVGRWIKRGWRWIVSMVRVVVRVRWITAKCLLLRVVGMIG